MILPGNNRWRETDLAAKLEVLLVEDDIDMSMSIIDYLNIEGMRCDYARTGAEGINLAKNSGIPYDCIILDINIPQIDGITLCSRLRHEGLGTPVIMLTACDHLDDKLKAFAEGADDYLTKPFAMEELVARIKALSLRGKRGAILRCGELTMDIKARKVFRKDKELKLNGNSWAILKLLMLHHPEPVKTEDIIRELWGDEPPASNTLHVHLHNLRKIVDGPFQTQIIRTVPGYGVALAEE